MPELSERLSYINKYTNETWREAFYLNWYLEDFCSGVVASSTPERHQHTGKCIRRFGGINAYCRYFIDRKW